MTDTPPAARHITLTDHPAQTFRFFSFCPIAALRLTACTSTIWNTRRTKDRAERAAEFDATARL